MAQAPSEKEKMLAGQLYYAFDAELLIERTKARALLHDYNNCEYSDIQGRTRVLGQLLGRMDPDNPPFIEPPFRCDYGQVLSHFGSSLLEQARWTALV